MKGKNRRIVETTAGQFLGFVPKSYRIEKGFVYGYGESAKTYFIISGHCRITVRYCSYEMQMMESDFDMNRIKFI